MNKLLITGHPRSATGYMAKIMQAAGLSIGHEAMCRDGLSSWLHIKPVGRVSWAGEIKQYDYKHIIHVVRNPFDMITTKTIRRFEMENLIEKPQTIDMLPFIRKIFANADVIMRLKKGKNFPLIDVYHE